MKALLPSLIPVLILTATALAVFTLPSKAAVATKTDTKIIGTDHERGLFALANGLTLLDRAAHADAAPTKVRVIDAPSKQPRVRYRASS